MDISTLGLAVDSRQVRTAHGDLDRFAQSGKRADNSAKGLTASGKRMGVSMAGAARGIAAAAAAAASLVASIRGIAEFDRQLSKVQAVSRATASEMEGLRDVAMSLGSATEFSAQQAAEGLEFLSRAGWSAQESISAIPAVLDLATASAMGLGAAADTASNIMSGFGLAASRASDVADVLAAASSRANTNVGQLGDAMSFVGPVASSLEIDMSATAAAIGVLSDAGIQGSAAGTGLRRVLSSLVNPTNQAAAALDRLVDDLEAINPQANDLSSIIDTLATSGMSAAEAMQIFGDRGGPAILALVSQNDRLRELSGELTNVEGEASRMANTMRDNLGGDIDALWSSVQGLILAMGDAGLTAIFRGIIQLATHLARGITSIVQAVGQLTGYLGGVMRGFRELEAGVDSVTLAMGDQIEQSNRLNALMRRGGTITLQEAQNQLELALARREEVQAQIEQQRELIRSSEQFENLERRVEALRHELSRHREDLELFESGSPMFQEIEKDILAAQIALGDLLNRRAELLRLNQDDSEAVAQIEANIERLRGAIARSEDGVVSFNSEIMRGIDLSNRLNVALGSIDMTPLTAQAAELAQQLGISVSHAVSLMDQLDRMSAMSGEAEGFTFGLPSLGDPGLGEEYLAFGDTLQNTRRHVIDLTSSMGDLSSSTSGAGSSAAGATNEFERLAKHWQSRTRTDLERYNAGIEELTSLLEAGAIDGETYARGIEQLNDELAESLPLVNDLANAWADWIVSGFQDFQGFVDSVLNSFRNMLRDMIAMAVRNRIMIPIVAAMSGGGAAAVSAATGGGGGLLSGLMGSVLGNFGGHGSILGLGGLGGGAGFLGGLGNAVSGGLGGIFQVGLNASAAGGGLLATLGAAMPIIAGIGLIASALIGSKKTVGAGLQGTLGGDQGALAEQFKDVQTRRLFGLIRSTRRHTDPAPEIESMLAGISLNLQERVENMADALDLDTKGLEDVLLDFDIDTRDMDEAQIQQALQEQLSAYGDSLAELVLGRPLDELLSGDQDFDVPIGVIEAWKLQLKQLREQAEQNPWDDEIKRQIEALETQLEKHGVSLDAAAKAAKDAEEWTNKWAKEGEGALDTLERLYNSMIAVNRVMDTLGHDFRAIGLEGADMASKLVDAFGGLEAMDQATSRFFELFYTEEERRATITRQVTERLSDLNLTMPQTRDQLREMVEGLDLSTESGREAYATLISLSEAFDFILPQMKELSRVAMELHGVVASDLDQMIAAATQESREALNAARQWSQAARGLRDFITRLESVAGALVSPQSALANTQARFDALMQAAMGGDQQAARDLPQAAGRLLDAAGATARDATELARVESQVLRDMRLMSGVADVEQMRHEAIAHILDEQLSVLVEVRDFMRQGGVLNEEMIADLNGELKSLEDALKAAEMINYQFLKERLDVAVDLLVDADIPDDVRQIIANTAEGIERDIDVIFNTAWLSPEERWLALTAASEHIRTVEMLIDGPERWGEGARWLALDNVSHHRRTIDFVLGQDLDQETRRIALAASSELSRIVNAQLDEKQSDRRALWLALQDTREQAVHIIGHLHRDNSKGMRNLIESIGGVTEGKLNLGGSFEFDPSKAFSTWFEGALSDGFETPLDRLRGPLEALRESLDDLRTQHWIDRLTPDTIVSRMPDFDPDTVRGDFEGVHRAWTGQIARLAHLLGVSMTDDSGDILGFQETRRAVARAARDQGVIGPNEMIWHAGGGLSDSDWAQWLRDNMPGFASGGLHSGGLRIVGEHGPELEATGPSRIYSAPQTRSMLGNSEVVVELRALRREVATLREQNRQLDTQIVRHTKRQRDILTEWNAIGLPQEQTS